jgi:hypothetical protein
MRPAPSCVPGLVAAASLLLATAATAQDQTQADQPGRDRPPAQSPQPDGPRPPGPGRGPGGGGPGGPMGEERKLVKQFDTDNNGWLNKEERAAARAHLKENPVQRPGPRRGGNDDAQSTVRPGEKLSPGEVENYPDHPLYDPSILRTIFLEFENEDWEAELADFYGTDVEVPATMTVDGKRYEHVGVGFRGASSFFMIPAGKKRSFNIAMDAIDKDQRLYGYRTLNLLNGNGDASFNSSALFSHIAREHIPAPEANFVKVAVNGEYWGVYVNIEQFNADFVKKHYGSAKGARWKVRGSPNAHSGLDYIGDNVEEYKRRYDQKAGNAKDWQAFIQLCDKLTNTPIEDLEAELRPILDLDEVMWFLALDIGLVNSDGYWTRASDYSIYRDEKGVFHIIPHDMNEAFSTNIGGPRGGGGPGGPGRGGPPPRDGGPGPDGPPPRDGGGPDGGGPDRPRPPRQDGGGPRGAQRAPGFALDPFQGMEEHKPLRSRLLQVPSLRAQYLRNLKTLAEKDLAWENVGPVITANREMISDALDADTRKLAPYEAFDFATSPLDEASEAGRPTMRSFIAQRRGYLLRHPEIAALEGESSAPARERAQEARP